jgi:hypothetical protein
VYEGERTQEQQDTDRHELLSAFIHDRASYRLLPRVTDDPSSPFHYYQEVIADRTQQRPAARAPIDSP